MLNDDLVGVRMRRQKEKEGKCILFNEDCHGLPVEYEIDKTLNIKGPDDVAAMGIATYNDHCRKIVMRYAHEWEVS